MQLDRFRQGLAAIIGAPGTERPFVCDGSPLTAQVFLVGCNPATTSERDFWSFWTTTGFDRAAWLSCYLEDRATRPLKPGRTRRQAISPTRRIIQWVIDATTVPVLETNVFSMPSSDIASLKKRDSRAFRYLLETIRPRILVAHGRDATQEIQRISPACRVIDVPHFSRNWSRTAAQELGRSLREMLEQG